MCKDMIVVFCLSVLVGFFLLVCPGRAEAVQGLVSVEKRAAVKAEDVNVTDLVSGVHESENWIHHIDSLYLRIESKWTQTPEGIAAKRAELKKRILGDYLDLKRYPSLKPIRPAGILEYAFDQKRVRFMTYDPDHWRQLTIWDGNELMVHEKYFTHEQETYFLKSTPQGAFHEFIAVETSWPRSQAHSFWFDSKDTEELIRSYGQAKDFVLTGRSNYRGIDCYVLDCDLSDVQGVVAGLLKRWYVGTKDRLLYGIETLRYGKLFVDHWALDYKEVVPGCWLPMTQGYEIYREDSSGKSYVKSHRDIKVLEVRINEILPDELFKMEFKDGVTVADRRSDDLAVYPYRPEPQELIGKALPVFEGIEIEFDAEQTKGKKLLVCFFDIGQRPSRHCVRELAKKAEQLEEKGITIAAVQASRIDKSKLDKWVEDNNIGFAVGMIGEEEEEGRFNWGVKRLPWLILTDTEHIVRAEGFGLGEVDKKTGAISQK